MWLVTCIKSQLYFVKLSIFIKVTIFLMTCFDNIIHEKGPYVKIVMDCVLKLYCRK